jgi:hypothetical protein
MSKVLESASGQFAQCGGQGAIAAGHALLDRCGMLPLLFLFTEVRGTWARAGGEKGPFLDGGADPGLSDLWD